MSEQVFKLVNKTGNGELSKMDKATIKQLLSALDDYYLELRSHILEYSSSPKFNRDLIEKREKNVDRYNLSEYNRIDLEEALEVCDLLFNNNIDKLYFLRQYLKSNQTSNRPLVKAKKFTK